MFYYEEDGENNNNLYVLDEQSDMGSILCISTKKSGEKLYFG